MLPDKRRARRLKVFLLGELNDGGGAMRVHVINISSTGAMLHAATPPFQGTKATLQISGRDTAATVTWRNKERFGVNFIEPLAELPV